MTTIGNYTVHPAAKVYPLIEGDEFDALVKDIKEYGLLKPIILDKDGLLLDGRNRLKACLELEREVETEVYEGTEPYHYVLSLNSIRRHLDAGLRAFYADELLQAAETAKNGASTQEVDGIMAYREKVAQAAGTCSATVASATYLRRLENDSALKPVRAGAKELRDKVRTRKITLNKAASAGKRLVKVNTFKTPPPPDKVNKAVVAAGRAFERALKKFSKLLKDDESIDSNKNELTDCFDSIRVALQGVR